MSAIPFAKGYYYSGLSLPHTSLKPAITMRHVKNQLVQTQCAASEKPGWSSNLPTCMKYHCPTTLRTLYHPLSSEFVLLGIHSTSRHSCFLCNTPEISRSWFPLQIPNQVSSEPLGGYGTLFASPGLMPKGNQHFGRGYVGPMYWP